MKWMLGLAVCAVALVGGVQSALAGAPWCARYSGIGEQNCGFYTLAQCRTDISGIGGVCFPNPAYDRKFAGHRFAKHRRHFPPRWY
jgi:hypothetical protein